MLARRRRAVIWTLILVASVFREVDGAHEPTPARLTGRPVGSAGV